MTISKEFNNFLKKNGSIAVILLIAYVAIFIMAFFGIIRIFKFATNIPFIYNISDLLWVFSATLLLLLLPIDKIKKVYKIKVNPKISIALKYAIALIPFCGVMIDEFMQKYWSNYPKPQNEIASYFWSGTFDVLDLVAYVIGAICAILVYKIITNKEKKLLENS